MENNNKIRKENIKSNSLETLLMNYSLNVF